MVIVAVSMGILVAAVGLELLLRWRRTQSRSGPARTNARLPAEAPAAIEKESAGRLVEPGAHSREAHEAHRRPATSVEPDSIAQVDPIQDKLVDLPEPRASAFERETGARDAMAVLDRPSIYQVVSPVVDSALEFIGLGGTPTESAPPGAEEDPHPEPHETAAHVVIVPLNEVVPAESESPNGTHPAGAGINELQDASDASSPISESPETRETVDTLQPAAAKTAVPRKYRPSGRGGPKVPTRDQEREGAQRARALPIEVRARLERGGFCRVTFIARRGESFPEELAVAGGGGPIALVAMQEEWYQDVEPPRIATLLERGAVWSGEVTDSRAVQWSLSGREIHVMGPREEISGFVSVPRLLLGEDHVVLFKAEREAEVREALRAAGAASPQALDWSEGHAEGWSALGKVKPVAAVAPQGHGDLLDVLRPAPDARMSLSGGIRITRSGWLAGFPPAIRIVGDAASAGVLYIDGLEALPDELGNHTVAGWDAPGEHAISCLCGTRTYQIAVGLEAWEPWDAYTWSSGDTSSQEGIRPAMCGLLVLPPGERRTSGRLFSAPASNALLIGSVPGQVFVCENRPDLRARTCTGYPPFQPAWALPTDPLHCDKSSSRILRVGSIVPFPGDTKRRSRTQERLLLAWAQAVLDATRKGLQVEPSDEATMCLWLAYKKEARAIWRGLR